MPAVAIHAPKVARISARERAIATLAVTLGGLLLARGTKGQPVSDEILVACRKWALPELDAKPASGSSARKSSRAATAVLQRAAD